MQHFPKVLDYLDEFGMPWRLCRDLPIDWPLWNGSWLFVVHGTPRNRNRRMTTDLILHELAHWQLEAEYRHLPNYGLGLDPLEGGPQEWRRLEAERREDLASVMTVCHARARGAPRWQQVAYDFGAAPTNVNMRQLTWSVFIQSHREFRDLYRLGLVDKQGNVCRP